MKMLMVDPKKNQQTEPWSMTSLYEEYARRGAHYAFSILGNSSDSEDVVQDAFCRLMASKSNTQQNKTFAPLFFTTVRNLCIDRVRQLKRRKNVSLHQVAEPVDAEQDDFRKHSEDVPGLAKLTLKLITELPDNWADALKLKVDGKLSYDEIASVLNCTRAQVRTWIYRARRQLESELKERMSRRELEKPSVKNSESKTNFPISFGNR